MAVANFPVKKRYEGIRLDVVSGTMGRVGVKKCLGKKHNVTRLTCVRSERTQVIAAPHLRVVGASLSSRGCRVSASVTSPGTYREYPPEPNAQSPGTVPVSHK